MKNTLLTLTLSLSSIVSLLAQEGKNVAGSPIGGIVIGRPIKKPGINISVSANGGSSSSGGVSNNISFNPNLNIELAWGGFGIGLDAGTFRTKPDLDFNSYSAPLKSMGPIVVTNTRNNWTSTYILVGPQYTFGNSAARKIAFTLSAKGGIGINKAPDFFVIDKEMNQQPIAEYRPLPSYKQNAFVLKPGATFTYWLTEKFAVHANAQYLLQTGQDEFATRYKDLSKVDFNQSEAKKVRVQIQGQSFLTANTKGPASYLSAGIGITYSIQKHSKGTSSSGKSIKSRVPNEEDELPASAREARDKIKNLSIKVSSAGKIALTSQQLEKLFTPLATEGFAYHSTSIITDQDSNYLVAVFENASTKMQETIGLPMHNSEGAAYVSGGDKPIKCGFNIYCTCNPPLCLGCTRPGGTTVEQCGFAKSGSAMQLVAYFTAFADLGK